MYLNCHSQLSMRWGTMRLETLADKAVSLGIKAIALTDINDSGGLIDFVDACNKRGIKPIGGIDFREGYKRLYIGIARSNEGLHQLNSFFTDYNLSKSKLPVRAPELPEVYFLYPLHCLFLQQHAEFTPNLRPDEFVALPPSEAPLLHRLRGKVPLHRIVFCQSVSFSGAKEYELHCHLRAIDNNILLSSLKPEMTARQSDSFLLQETFLQLQAQFPEVMCNTMQLMDNCCLEYDFVAAKNKLHFTESLEDDAALLKKLAWEGFQYRYGAGNDAVKVRMERELQIILQMKFAAYFLITHDIVQYGLWKGYYHIGRGSGANSLIAYCLRITDVDPIKLELYFERFLNPKRSSPPDFDIDYSWNNRDDIFNYIFRRHKQGYTALLGTVSTFSGRSTLRELGKVYGLPKKEIDRLTDEPAHRLNGGPVVEKIVSVSSSLRDFPNLRSIHAGGVLISELPITHYSALHLPPKGLPTVQWDMFTAEKIQLHKYDILSQRGIGHINDAAAMIRERHDPNFDIHNIPHIMADEKVADNLYAANSLGCFYIESPAMRQLLKKLRCRDYLTLVAASSIIRPGVAGSGMMSEFIRRFHAQDNIEYLHPVFKEQLGETYGVMVYQEDVMKICHHYAGLDLGDADVLRRAMSGKYRSSNAFAEIEEGFFKGAAALGRDRANAEEAWRQISSFAGYSFCKAHSASYAVESYQSLYLKTYYPREFMAAVINNFGGFYRTWVYVQEARRTGVKVCLPCVNRGLMLTSLNGDELYLGLIHIKGLEKKWIQGIPAERVAGGSFLDLPDFVNRTGIPFEQIRILIKTGALRFTGMSKPQLITFARLFCAKSVIPETPGSMLFNFPVREFVLPVPEPTTVREDAWQEFEILGFPVTLNHFGLLPEFKHPAVNASNLHEYIGKFVTVSGKLVTTKPVRTVHGDSMMFGNFLDADANFIDTVHFPDSLKNYPVHWDGIYLLWGRVIDEFGVLSLEVHKCKRLDMYREGGEKLRVGAIEAYGRPDPLSQHETMLISG
ncbi:MAG: DNA polymerase III subunit alpha [Bacteroidota bacterium]